MQTDNLTLTLFGAPQIERGGQRCHIATRKATALLIYLAVTRQPQTRETIAALFWPESPASRAKASLRRALSDIKKAVGDDLLEADRNNVYLNSDLVAVDVHQYRAALNTTGDHELLVTAAQLYRDDFLKGFTLSNCYDFDEWRFFEAENLRQSFASVLGRLVAWSLAQHKYEQGIPYGRRLIALDLLHEPAYAKLMRLYTLAGQQAAAIRLFQECERVLDEELGVAPGKEVADLHRQILAGELTAPAAIVTPTQPSPAPSPEPQQPTTSPQQPAPSSHNLPNDLTSFVGRVKELEELAGLLGDDSIRMVTVTAFGGMGKTRIALAAARQQVGRFADGVWLVDLAPLQSCSFLLTAIAGAIGFLFQGTEDPKIQLLRHLQDKNLLLLLDNFEHIVEEAPFLSEIVRGTDGVQLLVTSRERLDLQEEWVFELGGLDYPKPLLVSEETSHFLLSQPDSSYSAVQLFIQRARQAKRGFVFSAEKTHVLRICALTEGMPLALELAAAWVRMLPCDQIVSEIERNLDLLSSNQRNLAERHRSVRIVFESSWGLLNSAEQQLLARLSIFRGSFDWSAVQAITGASLPTLLGLLNKSLVRTIPVARYELHELLRQFAAGKLESLNDDSTSLADLHSEYFAEWLHSHQHELYGSEHNIGLNRIAKEIDNVYQAWFHAVDRSNFAHLEQSLHSVFNFHIIRSLLEPGSLLFQHAIEKIEPQLSIASTKERMLFEQMKLQKGELLQSMGQLPQAQTLFEDARSNAQKFALPDILRGANRNLGLLAYQTGNYPNAMQHLLEALKDSTRNDDKYDKAYLLMTAGAVALAMGNYEKAELLQSESLQIYRKLNYDFGIVHTLRFLGDVSHQLDDLESAKTYHQQSLEHAQSFHYQHGEALAYNNLGRIAQQQNQPDVAHELFQKAIQWSRETQTAYVKAVSLQNMGQLLLQQNATADGMQFLKESLMEASQAERTPLMLDILVDMVDGIPALKDGQFASQVITVALDHPSSTKKTQLKAKAVLSKLDVETRNRLRESNEDISSVTAIVSRLLET